MVQGLSICINSCSCKSTEEGDVFCSFSIHSQKITFLDLSVTTLGGSCPGEHRDLALWQKAMHPLPCWAGTNSRNVQDSWDSCLPPGPEWPWSPAFLPSKMNNLLPDLFFHCSLTILAIKVLGQQIRLGRPSIPVIHKPCWRACFYPSSAFPYLFSLGTSTFIFCNRFSCSLHC